jgi:DNA-binding IclR family transcriptional regulator
VSHGEIDPGRIGVGAPIFGADRAVLGSLSVVLSATHTDAARIAALAPLTVAGARDIEQTMSSAPALGKPSPARVKIARSR